MKLFHTSNREIREPDIHRGRANADFGQGFYLSPDEDFAGNWARERTAGDIYVNVYELDVNGLAVKTFGKTEDWFRYIFSNRMGREDSLAEYDVITGPVASDTLFETFGIVTSGLLTDEQALELLNIGPEYRQTVIKSRRACDRLCWVDSYILGEEVMDLALENYNKEREAFDIAFAEALEKMDIN